MNLIDRVLLPLDPERVARRQRARLQVEQLAGMQVKLGADSGTQGGSMPSGLLRWWRPASRSADADTLRDLPDDRARSRELVRTNGIAAGAIRTNVDRVVGTGLALSAQPARGVLGWTEDQLAEWKRNVQTEFSLWADSPECDLTGRGNFFDLQGLTLRAADESGDCFTVLPDAQRTASMPYALRLQTIEADRVGNPGGKLNTPTMVAGIELGEGGRPRRCHVYRDHPGALSRTGAARVYDGDWLDFVGQSGRRRVLHHYRQLRPEQTRGVPYLTPVVDLLKQLARYSEAEIQAAVVSAFFTVFIETEGGSPAPVFTGADTNAATGEIGMGPAAVVGLAKGEKAVFADPNRPNTAFQPFVLAILQQIGVGLGIPFELLIKQFNSSYSASRAALLDAWMHFRAQRTWLARSFCQPVYETWLAEAVLIGRVSAPGFFSDPLLRWAYTRAEWHGDSQGSINPKDEVAAYVAAIDNRLMTRERAEWELFGTDWQATYDAKRAEHQRLAADEMLPVPKAGAAAPNQPQPARPAQPDPTE